MAKIALPILVLVLSLGAILMGVYLIYLSFKLWKRIKVSQNWNKTKGEITHARLGYAIVDNENVNVRFHILKTYEYSISGVTYTNDSRLASENIHIIFYTPMDEKEKRVKNLLKRKKLKYPEKRKELLSLVEKMKGDTVTVYYNPKAYEDSCIRTKMPNYIYFQLVMAILIFSAGGLLLNFWYNVLI